MVEAVQLLQALSVHEGNIFQELVLQQAAHHAFHGVGKGLHEGGAVLAVVIAQHDGLLALAAIDIDAQGELGGAGLQVLARDALSVHAVIGQDAYLVGQHHLRLEAEVGGYFGEGVFLVLQGSLEVLVALLQEGLGVLNGAVSLQGQGVYEHAETVGRPEVAATVADGTDINLLAGAVGAQAKVGGAQIEAGGRDAQRLAQGVDIGAHLPAQEDLAAALSAGLQVRNNGRRAFQAGELPGKEFPGPGIGLAAFGGLLLGRVLEIGIAFRGDVLSFQCGADFLDEDVVAAAVEDQVVEVAQKVGVAAFGKDFHLAEGTFPQVEGAGEAFPCGLQAAFPHGDGNGNVRGNLANLSVPLFKAALQRRVGGQHLFHGLFERPGRHFSGEGPQHGNVVDGLVGSLHAVQVHAGLLVGEGLGVERFFALRGAGRAAPFHELFKHFVFNALQGCGFGKAVHIGLNAVALEQLRCQA